jgi:hypothetical protein
MDTLPIIIAFSFIGILLLMIALLMLAYFLANKWKKPAWAIAYTLGIRLNDLLCRRLFCGCCDSLPDSLNFSQLIPGKNNFRP